MKRRWIIVFLSILIGTSFLPDAAALGLGDAMLKSRLNEPLEVEIALIGANTGADSLNAAIGTQAMHEAAGITAVKLLGRLRTDVIVSAGRGAHVRIYTEKALREPVVRFLLVVESARGRLAREYTVLLDPPGYSLPTIAVPEPMHEPAPASKVAEALSRPPSIPAPSIAHDLEQIGPVSPGDTLSKLAMGLRNDPGVTWAQMTWALYKANPQAFLDDDINLLRSNVYLSVPSAETASRWSHRDAVALIKGTPANTPMARASNREQTTQSPSTPAGSLVSPSESAVPSVPPGDDPPATALESAANAVPGSPQPVLRLLSSDTVGNARGNGPADVPMTAKERERVRQLMVQANNQIEESEEEMARARGRLAETEQQVSTLVEALAMKGSEIEGLEGRLADLQELTMKQSIAMSRPEPSWLHRLFLEVLLLTAMVGIFAVILSRWADARRRQRVGADVATDMATDTDMIELTFPTLENSHNQTPPVVADDDGLAGIAAEESRAEISVNEKPSVDHTEIDKSVVRDATLTEVNAYCAYGYHDKAKEVLTELIKLYPAHAESRLVMLRILHALSEKRKFKRHAEALLELVDDYADERWIEAARLGRAVLPEERLFDADAHKRSGDNDWEKTVWTGTHPGLGERDEQVYLDIDDFKHVDLMLLDDADGNGAPASSSSTGIESDDSEMGFTTEPADMPGGSEDGGLGNDPVDSGDDGKT
jgi:pilus assembly protein FimV